VQSRPPPSDEQKMKMKMKMKMKSTQKGLDDEEEEWFLPSCRSAFERPRTMKSNPKNAFWKPEKKKRALLVTRPNASARRLAKSERQKEQRHRAKENTAALPRFWREKKERRRLKHSRESDMF